MFNNLYVPGVNMFPSQQQRQVQYPQPMQPMPNYQQQNMMQSQLFYLQYHTGTSHQAQDTGTEGIRRADPQKNDRIRHRTGRNR